MKAVVYIRRSLKFLVTFAVLYAAAMWIMIKLGLTPLTPQQIAHSLVHDPQSITLVCVIIAWAALYPAVSFIERRVEADCEADRERIENAFFRSGYKFAGRDAEERLVFRAASLFRRLRTLFEDKITVGQYGQWVVLKGRRRNVAEVEMRLKSYMQNVKRHEAE